MLPTCNQDLAVQINNPDTINNPDCGYSENDFYPPSLCSNFIQGILIAKSREMPRNDARKVPDVMIVPEDQRMFEREMSELPY